ncbi:MAG: lysylphosphatidylglycerol synthase transmembrane domain-containing protein [Actinomycetota bacterium]|nr:lysylphosphatidylglycerol synthase transmembrane domain-containing protein [Actinomycetota bacterium]
MNAKRVLWIAGISAVIYIGVAYWVLNNFEIPKLSGSALAIVIGAAIAQIGAKWFFGLLFRESIEQTGAHVRPWTAFKAALVGAGIARMIPAGGAITPVGMSWTVRDETKGSTAGAAIRTVLLNYAGLLIMTGMGLLIARPKDGAQLASISLIVLAPFVLVAGLGLMFGSGKLGTITKYLPRFIREKLEDTTVDHLPKLESQVYIWARLILEAGALWLVLFAFGIDVGGFQVAAAFGVASLAGGLPGTPGGLGVTEFGLAFILSAYGIPASTAAVPILVFRLVSYWLPAALGFLAGGSTFLHSDAARAVESRS